VFIDHVLIDTSIPGKCARCGCSYNIGPESFWREGGLCGDLSWLRGTGLPIDVQYACPGRIYREDTLDALPSSLQELQGQLRTYHERKGRGWVYFLCDAQRVLYIGQTQHLQHRLELHRQQKKIPWVNAYVLETHVHYLTSTERQWIRKLRPPYNRTES
jgi:hypothetical protein